MRARLFGAALLASTALLAVAPSALAQQYGGYPSGYGTSSQPSYGPPYGGGYGGGYTAASPYAGVCAALAYSAATQGYAALAASPYTRTCEYLGLLGSIPASGYASGGAWVAGSGVAAWTGLSYPGSLLGSYPSSASGANYGDGCSSPLYGASGYSYAYGSSGSYCALTGSGQ